MTPTTSREPHRNSTGVCPQPFDTDVAIVGGGPVGFLLAILLERHGHQVTLVEKWPAPYSQPRAVTYDHEIARILAILGIDSDHDDAVDYHDDVYYWKNAAGQTLLEVDWASMAESGWRTRYWFSQPGLENRLRDVAAGCEGIEVRRNWLASHLEQDAQGITLSGIRGGLGAEPVTEHIRARYVVGADGANSFVRQALGLSFEDHGFFFDWLILDLLPHEPMEFTPTHWQLCDPARPTTIVPGGPGRRRWEYMVLPGESAAELSTPEAAWKLLEPWGATPENSTLERSAVYRFHARWANAWRNGRGLIAGDAAHLMPPFAGEGMCAGLRDAVALAWRLDLVLSGKSGDAVLDSYGTERSVHVQSYIDFSMELGKIICIADPEEAAARDARMIEELAQSDGGPVNTDIGVLGPGIWSADCPEAGVLSVQGVVESEGRRGRFDEVMGRGWMVISRRGESELLRPDQQEALRRLGGRMVNFGPDGDFSDSEGTYGTWLDRLGVNHVVIRPDFYLAATAATGQQLRQEFDGLLQALHVAAGAPVASNH